MLEKAVNDNRQIWCPTLEQSGSAFSKVSRQSHEYPLTGQRRVCWLDFNRWKSMRGHMSQLNKFEGSGGEFVCSEDSMCT